MPPVKFEEIVIDPEEGTRLVDLKTPEECDAAYHNLTLAIASIESQIERERDDAEFEVDHEWLGRATAALRIRKSHLNLVQQRKAQINLDRRMTVQKDRDRQLVQLFKEFYPAAFADLCAKLDAG